MPSLSVWSRAAEHLLPPRWLEALRCPRRWIDAPHWACLQFGFRHFPISAWSAQGLRRGTKEINTCSSSSRPCRGISSPEPSPLGTLAPRLCAGFVLPRGEPTSSVSIMINITLSMNHQHQEHFSCLPFLSQKNVVSPSSLLFQGLLFIAFLCGVSVV